MRPGSRGGGVEGWETWRLYRARATRPAPARPTGACCDSELPRAGAPRVSLVRPGLRLRPRSHLSRLGSRAFKEPSARPRPARLRALLHVMSPAPAPTPAGPRGPGRLGGCPGNCSPRVQEGSAPRHWLQCGHPAQPLSPPHHASSKPGAIQGQRCLSFCPWSVLRSLLRSDRSCAGSLGESGTILGCSPPGSSLPYASG